MSQSMRVNRRARLPAGSAQYLAAQMPPRRARASHASRRVRRRRRGGRRRRWRSPLGPRRGLRGRAAARSERDTGRSATRAAWERGDWAAHARASSPARAADALRRCRAFARRYRDARPTATATARARPASRADDGDGHWRLPVTLRHARVRARSARRCALAVERGRRPRAASTWQPEPRLPGPAPPASGCARTTRMPAARRPAGPRRHAAGAGRRSARRRSAPTAAAIVGALGPIAARARARALRAARLPGRRPGRHQRAGARLRRAAAPGTPGGAAARRRAALLADRAPRKAAPVRTTIAPARAGGRGHGAGRAPRRRRGAAPADRRGARGRRHRLQRPPAAGLDVQDHHRSPARWRRGVAKPRDTFPVQTAATLEGVELQNANGESCGGTLAQSFAESCNSVFAPLGAQARRRGARRRPPRRSASTSRPASRAPRRRPSPRPARSATTSRSARRRSARGACRPPRCRWRSSPRRSACAAGARRRRSTRTAAGGAPTHAATSPRSRARSSGSCSASCATAPARRAAIPGVAGRRQDRDRRAQVDARPASPTRPEPGVLPARAAAATRPTPTPGSRLRAGGRRAPADRGRRAARRRRRRRRHRGAGGAPGAAGGAEELSEGRRPGRTPASETSPLGEARPRRPGRRGLVAALGRRDVQLERAVRVRRGRDLEEDHAALGGVLAGDGAGHRDLVAGADGGGRRPPVSVDRDRRGTRCPACRG